MASDSVNPYQQGLTQKRWWPWFRRIAALGFFALVATLLVLQAQEIEWRQVLSSLARYPMSAIWSAAALTAASLLLYSCFDLLGRRYTEHQLGTASVMTTTFVSYVFNLNLGSLVGALGMRYRLYSRLGLGLSTIARVVSLSMLTNWMGYLLLAGLMFSLQPPALPDSWGISSLQLRLGGAALLALVLAYLAACGFLKQRSFELRGHTIELPSTSMALLQLLMGAANWLLMASIIYVLLLQRIDLATVVSVLLLAAVAGVITHIPGNLGVLEAVFVALLSNRMPAHELVAGLVAYRLVYFLLPLALAAAVFVGLELAARKQRANQPAQFRPAPAAKP
jgi:hypothetical protein